jgi:SOS-response transcriptional repressor LexA
MGQSGTAEDLTAIQRLILRFVHARAKRTGGPPTAHDVLLDIQDQSNSWLHKRRELDLVLAELERSGAVLLTAGENPRIAILPKCFAQGWLPHPIPLLSTNPTTPPSILTEVVGAMLAFVVAHDDGRDLGIRLGDVVVVGEGKGVWDGLFVDSPSPHTLISRGKVEGGEVVITVGGHVYEERRRIHEGFTDSRLLWRVLNVIRNVVPMEKE